MIKINKLAVFYVMVNEATVAAYECGKYTHSDDKEIDEAHSKLVEKLDSLCDKLISAYGDLERELNAANNDRDELKKLLTELQADNNRLIQAWNVLDGENRRITQEQQK